MDQAVAVNNLMSEDLIELSGHMMHNQEAQEAEINQLKARINELTKVPPKQSASTKHYCHLHGPNNTNEEER